MKSYSDISIRNLKINKKRSILTATGIMLATTIIFAIFTFIFSMRDSQIKMQRLNEGDSEVIYSQVDYEDISKIKNHGNILDSGIGTKKTPDSFKTSLVIVTSYDEDGFKRSFTEKMDEGTLPKNNKEILVPKQFLAEDNLKIGDKFTTNNGNEYIITGTYSPSFFTSGQYNLYPGLDSKNLDKAMKYDVAVNFKDKKKISENAKNIYNELKLSDNGVAQYQVKNIAKLYGDINSDSNIFKSLFRIGIVVILIIGVSTISVIYNSFNMSVIERIREFGILKAMGATRDEMRMILYKEAFLMLLAAIPLGIITGYLSLWALIKIIYLNSSFKEMMNIEISVGFYPMLILVTIAVVIVTTFISVWGPARKVAKVSPVVAMRNINEIKTERIKKRKNRLIKKIFGIEGALAYKNTRRSPKRFILTVIALTISILIFNVFYSLVLQTQDTLESLFTATRFEASITANQPNTGLPKELLSEIDTLDGVKEAYKTIETKQNLIFPEDKINSDAVKALKSQNPELDKMSLVEKETDISAMDRDVFDKMSKEDHVGNINYEEMVKKNGVVLVDKTKINKDGKITLVKYTNYNVGDKIRVPKVDNNPNISITEKVNKAKANNDYIELEVVGIVEKEYFTNSYGVDSLKMYMPKEIYRSNFSNDEENNVFINYDEKISDEQLKTIEDKLMKEKEVYTYQSLRVMMEMINSFFSIVGLFVYAFITIITLIASINIFNTISAGLHVRRREFATLKGIGLTQGGLTKLVLLEGVLYGLFASIIGGGLSLLIVKFLGSVSVVPGEEAVSKLYLSPFLISTVVAILITYLASVFPLRKLKKMSVVQGIRQDG